MKDVVCALCRQNFKGTEKKVLVKPNGKHICLKAHIKCLNIIRKWKEVRSSKMPASSLVYSLWCGIYRWAWTDIVRVVENESKNR